MTFLFRYQITLSCNSKYWSYCLYFRSEACEKNGQNSIFSGARMLTFGNSFLSFGYVLKLSKSPNSALYHADVLNIDKQDDGAAYRLFSHEFLYEVSQTLNSDSNNKGLLIYLFIIGKYKFLFLFLFLINIKLIKCILLF